MDKESPQKSIAERSIVGFPIFIQKNSYPRGDRRLYGFISLERLLNDGQKLLGLNAAAKKVYNEEGKVVRDNEGFSAKNLYFVSTGEGFASGMKKPRPKDAPTDANTEEENKNEVDDKKDKVEKPKDEEKGSNGEAEKPNGEEKKQSGDAEKKVVEEKKKDGKAEKRAREAEAFNTMVALSNQTVESAFLESTLSAFMSTEPDQRAKLENFDQLIELTKNTQYFDFINHMITNQMAPTFAKSAIQEDVDMYVIDILKNLEINQVNFMITGLPQTGKSSILFSFANILMRKIQNSSQSGKILYFPLNAEKILMDLQSIKKTYEVFVTNTINSSRYSNYAIAPFVTAITRWFCSLPGLMVIPAFPHVPSHIHGIDFTAIQALGKSIFNISHDKDGLQSFLSAIVDFPLSFAKAIGLHSVLYIIDNFDYLNVEFFEEKLFPNSLKVYRLAPEICRILEEQKYVVTCKSESHFSQAFTLEMATPIDSEGIVGNYYKDPRRLIISPLNLVISSQNCKGCPGILGAFKTVADMAEKVGIDPPQNRAIKVAISVAKSREFMVKKELMRLLKCIAQSNDPLITFDTINRLDDQDIKVKVEGPKVEPQEKPIPENENKDKPEDIDKKEQEGNNDIPPPDPDESPKK